MNVVITLPVELIAEILEGRKTFEIRSKVPQKFNPDKDVVFVVEKTTKRIPLYFTIRTFYTYCQNESVDTWLACHASVPVSWVKTYRSDKLRISVWDIACVCKLCDENALWGKLELNTAPQSFIYKEYEWRQVPISKMIWSRHISIDERRTLMHPRAERNCYMTTKNNKTEYWPCTECKHYCSDTCLGQPNGCGDYSTQEVLPDIDDFNLDE